MRQPANVQSLYNLTLRTFATKFSFRFISELGDTEERVEFFLFYFDEEAKEEYMVGAERKELRGAGCAGNTRTFLEESLE